MILCAGEALVDILPTKGGAPKVMAGGAVFNTAIALGRLGVKTGFYWGLSQDEYGALLCRNLDAAGVDFSLCPRPDRPTTKALVDLSGPEAQYTFEDEGSAGRLLTPADLPSLPSRIEALFMGGISLCAEPCGSAMEALALGGLPLILDPNIRPAFITDEAPYRARLWRMIGAARIVKLSTEDAAWLAGSDDLEPLISAILAKEVRLLCLTKGAKGAELIWPKGRLFRPAPKVTVQDTIGAGDTFNAGLILGLIRHVGLSLTSPDPQDLEAALQIAQSAAALSTTRQGANPPWAAELGL